VVCVGECSENSETQVHRRGRPDGDSDTQRLFSSQSELRADNRIIRLQISRPFSQHQRKIPWHPSAPLSFSSVWSLLAVPRIKLVTMPRTAWAARLRLVGRPEMEASLHWGASAAPAANRAQGVLLRARAVQLEVARPRLAQGVLPRARVVLPEAARPRLTLGAHWLVAERAAPVAKRVPEA